MLVYYAPTSLFAYCGKVPFPYIAKEETHAHDVV